MNISQLSPNNNHVDMTDEPDGVWFGDPCYVFPEHDWSDFCNAIFSYEKVFEPGRHYVAHVTQSSGKSWYTWSTAYGDGCYRLQINGKTVGRLGVDAGMLAAIPMSLIKEWGATSAANSLGHVMNSSHCVGPLETDQGDMFWGLDITLPTGGIDEESESDEEWDEYWAECDQESYVS